MENNKCFILQQYAPSARYKDKNDCINIFYVEINGEDRVWLGYPERATRYETIGDAMRASVEIFNRSGIEFKAVEFTPKS